MEFGITNRENLKTWLLHSLKNCLQHKDKFGHEFGYLLCSLIESSTDSI